MVTGADMPGYNQVMGITTTANYTAHLTASSAPGGVLWPGERPSFSFQLVNTGPAALRVRGKVSVIAYGTRGAPGDVWTPHVFKIADEGSAPIQADIPISGFQDFTIAPGIPARFGGYALVVDLGAAGRQFLTGCVRTFRASSQSIQYPHYCLDDLPLPLLQRLGVHAVRWGVGYKPTTAPDFEAWYAERGRQLKAYHDAGVTVLFMAGGGDFNGPTQPLGRPRPWLDDRGVMQDTKFDLAWLPSYDGDFQEFCHRFARDYAWPRGPITGFSLWNEPWEGISISGWGADMLRYRAMYTHMWQGVDQARREDGAQALVGGGDSSSNAMDKLFPDGTDDMLPMFDFLSIHYQGLSSTANYKPWRDRTGPRGRVKIWDTESWVGNTDDRVAAIVAGDRAAGYDRAMGTFGGNVCAAQDYNQRLADGGTKTVHTVCAYSTAAAVGAATHFVGERPFQKLLFGNGLPWVMVFGGVNGNAEDGTAVVVGDLGEEFGADYLPFRTARGFAEIKHKNALRAQLAALPASAPAADREKLRVAVDTAETLAGATMTLPASPDYGLFDFYGNAVAARGGRIAVPLDGRGFFLRGSGRPGSFAALLRAIRAGRIDGIEPVSFVAHDPTAPIASRPALRLSVTNVLNRPVSGVLSARLGGLVLSNPSSRLTLAPNQTKVVDLIIAGGAPAADNTYPLSVVFDAGRDGSAAHRENMHVNVIARRTVRVDGSLSDWRGVLPETITAQGAGAPTMTEQAWLPFMNYASDVKNGLATAYLAYDDKYFYFSAKVADSTPDPGTVRFATRDDDQYFYPAVSYASDASGSKTYSMRWSGSVSPKYSETYTFTTVSDDGVRLRVDGRTLVDNWTDHGPTENAGAIALVAGHKYDIVMEYYNSGGGGTARLFWQSPSQTREIVPSAALSPASGTGPGLTGEYFSGIDLSAAKTTRTDPDIDFVFADGAFPDPAFSTNTGLTALTWPAGVRRYSYRKDPDLPAGNAPGHDNVQIAFNVLPPSKKRYAETVPGVMPGFVTTQDMDYEYALNEVAPQYGGGTEIWRLAAPRMPLKHYYPRQPKSPFDGPVKGGTLVIRRDGATLVYEAAIPWTEMPEVKEKLETGRTIKFSYRVNDNAQGPTMELSKGRSAAKRNGSFHVDWAEHWANEIEFGAQR